jgi:RHH-type proline utilization regulon transcriptional repressor/proline dehydrogenase/delta 1-pyrroline-5-carboxylate dehydrogenase
MAIVTATPFPPAPPLRAAIRDSCRIDESAADARILSAAALPAEMRDRIADRARAFVAAVRRDRHGKGGIDAFLHEYALSSPEGVALLCLAEALLRVPDAETVDRLIRDKIGEANWENHLGRSESIFVNASTWALMLTGRLLHAEPAEPFLRGTLRRLAARSGEPVVRQAVTAAMRILGRQFVIGRTIQEAIEQAREAEPHGYRHSYDRLGEAARTAADAARYFTAYDHAIAAIGQSAAGRDIAEAPGISVKLSALHPRYEMAQRDRVLRELLPRLLELACHARKTGIGFTIDTEEADRLELSLDLAEGLALAPDLAGWDGLGLAVQAYQKRALPVIDWLADLAGRGRRRLMVRLVKGAYWDSEIKRAQERGLGGYPVYTRKVATDVSYLACASRLLAHGTAFYTQFATHNAHTVAAVLELAGNHRDWEFQRLHGMGEALYEQIVGPEHLDRPCRIYAPVGSHEDLLPYLVRRLLENGANTSFVNRIVDDRQPIDAIIADPVARLARLPVKPHPRIPLPRELYAPERKNAAGLDLNDPTTLTALREGLAAALRRPRRAAPIIAGLEQTGGAEAVFDPSDRRRQVGEVVPAGPAHVDRALARAVRSAPAWDRTPAGERAALLEAAADLYEGRMPELMALIVREGGRTTRTRSRRCARRSITCAITRCARGRILPTPPPCPAPPASATRSNCAGAASSRASHRGTFRWRSSPAKSPQRSPPATRSPRSPPSRRRLLPPPRCGSCSRRGSPAMSCICCRGPARRSVRRWLPTRASPGSPLPGQPRPRAISTSNWRAVPDLSCRSSPRPAGRMR